MKLIRKTVLICDIEVGQRFWYNGHEFIKIRRSNMFKEVYRDDSFTLVFDVNYNCVTFFLTTTCKVKIEVEFSGVPFGSIKPGTLCEDENGKKYLKTENCVLIDVDTGITCYKNGRLFKQL